MKGRRVGEGGDDYYLWEGSILGQHNIYVAYFLVGGVWSWGFLVNHCRGH
jgi:hypothetical protein